MKLIGSYTSPYVRKVRVILLEKNLPFEFVSETPWEATTHVPDYNPLGKIPALVTNDGEILFESRIIAEYLDLVGAGPKLMSADPMAALRVRQVEALSDGITDAGVAIFREKQRPAAQQSTEWIARQQGKIERGLDALEARAKNEWLCGNAMSIADVATGCLLAWLDLRFADNNWRAKHPSLAKLAERVLARPSFQQTKPPV